MNPEEKELLQKTFKLAEENNKILHGIRKYNRRAMIYKTVYWVIIILVSLGALYYTQPYIDKAMKVFNTAEADLNNVKGVFGK